MDLNLRGTTETARFGNQSAIGGAVTFDPTQPVYTKSPRFGGYYEWLDPTSAAGLQNFWPGAIHWGLLEENYNKGTPERSIGNLQLDYKFHFLPDLHAKVNAGYDISKGAELHLCTGQCGLVLYRRGYAGGENNPYSNT